MARRGQISIHLHGAIELLVGAALVVLPFLFGFEPAAIAFSAALGALIIGLALSASSEPGGRGSIPLAAHAAYDWGLGVGLIAAGFTFGLLQGHRPMLFFMGAGAAELLLLARTRYAPARA
jgi:hypothetical protein